MGSRSGGVGTSQTSRTPAAYESYAPTSSPQLLDSRTRRPMSTVRPRQKRQRKPCRPVAGDPCSDLVARREIVIAHVVRHQQVRLVCAHRGSKHQHEATKAAMQSRLNEPGFWKSYTASLASGAMPGHSVTRQHEQRPQRCGTIHTVVLRQRRIGAESLALHDSSTHTTITTNREQANEGAYRH